MLGSIMKFELRYQLRNPLFWAAAAAMFLLAFAAMIAPNLRIGAPGNVHVNAPRAIAQLHLVFATLFMFGAAAFVADGIVRDDETGFGPIIRSTGISKSAYLIGRFLGGLLATALAFLAVPAALFAGSLMPWLDPETLGPTHLGDYLFAYLLLALPALAATSAMLFALAALTRSVAGTFLGVIAFLILYFVVGAASSQRPELRATLALLDPFGIAALQNATRYWTVAESNAAMPGFSGALLWSRLLWLAMAGLFLLLACRRYDFTSQVRTARELSEPESAPPSEAAETVSLPSPGFGAATAMLQLRERGRLEMKLVFGSPLFLVLLVLGLLHSAASLLFGGDMYGTPTLPVTRETIPVLITSFAIVPVIVATYYSGELVWRERDRKLHEIIDAAPLPNWAFLAPKMLAIALVLLTMLLLSTAVAIATQLAEGFTDVEPRKYLFWYVLPIGFDLILLAVLAVFIQALSPHKYVGWGVTLLYVILRMVSRSVGLDHNLYVYGQVPHVQYSDMNGGGSFLAAAWWYRLHWGAFAAALLIAAHLLWRRGTEARLKPRLRKLPARLRGALGFAALSALLATALTGGWIFYNTNILNDTLSAAENDRFAADYERRYLAFEKLPQPTISHVRLDVALYPSERRAVVKGRYELENRTGQTVRDVHVRLVERTLELLRLDFPGARLVRHDAEFGYRIYRLDRPMAPGEKVELSFETRRWQRGFRDRSADTNLVENGTFLNNLQIIPVIGMDRHGLIQEPSERRRLNLPPELRPAKLEDLSGTRQPLFGGGWTTADITVSTEADQTPIAPGRKVSDVTAGRRRTARFVSERPIVTFFSIQSARYAERRRRHGGVDLTVYHHPAHRWNVERMLASLESSLEYYRENFGPYQFDQVRITEFPAYAGFAQAFANTIPFSELIGFVADHRDPRGVDYVELVTAHEVAHQWWAHQVLAGNVQGATMLSETLAQYSALMVMKRRYGEHGVRRFLRQELDNYLRSRSFDPAGELPLARVENQGYIHYNKGAVAMYLLQQRLGEPAVNRALAEFVWRFRFRGPPFPRSTDLIQLLRAQAPAAAHRALITDLLERITIYDLKAGPAAAARRSDGRWDVSLTVEARKFYADSRGSERETRLDEKIEIGVFMADPASAGFDSRRVLLIAPRPLRTGRQVLHFITNRRPAYAGVDPYNYYIDRGTGDNLASVEDAKPRGAGSPR